MAAIVTPPTENTALTWLQKHERLIVALVILAIGAWGLNRYFNHVDAEDKQVATESQQQLQTQQMTNADYSATVNTLKSQLKDQSQQFAAINARIAAQASVKATQAKVQQQADQQMMDPEIVERWKQLSSQPTGIVATPTGAEVTTAAITDTVVKLDSIPGLQANNDALQVEKNNTETELTTANQLIGKQTTEIGGLNAQIVDQDKACRADIKLVNDKARKSKLKWFGAGFIVGFVAGVVK